MNKLLKAILLMVLLPVCLFAQEKSDSLIIDSITNYWDKELELNEIVVIGHRTVLKQSPDRIVYLTKNDIYAKGLNGIEVLDRIPRVSVNNDLVTVAGKTSVMYIVDGRLLEMSNEAITMQLKNLQASGIEKIELLTTPPAKYAAGANVAYISITTRNESLGTRGSIWGSGNIRESFNYMLGGNLSHTTRNVELSADVSWSDINGINDLERTYTFADHEKTSNRTTRFTNRALGINGLFKYKFSARLCAGIIANFNKNSLKSDLNDMTIDNGVLFSSYNYSPSRPNNAMTLTAFCDWQLDNKGKNLSLTYNYFSRSGKSFSDVITIWQDNESRISDEGHNKHLIHSVKLDAIVPFNKFKLETGMAFTDIGNKSYLNVNLYDGSQWIIDLMQSNRFHYDENTMAVYVSIERNFTDSFYGKLGLRYEYTDVKGRQETGNEHHNNYYGYLFPSLNLSWNNQKIGRFSISYSMGISRPNFTDLNPFRYYTTTSDYVSGNPDLRPSIMHNAEITYSLKGTYAVLYNSYSNNSIGYVTRFDANGGQQNIPENCFNSNKTGLYASYNRSLFDWWSLNVGGEVFHTYAKSKIGDFKDYNQSDWSGKLELNTSFMLNRQHSLVFNMRFSHYFPYNERMVHYESLSLIGCELRYMLFDKRFTLTASVSDPFGWNISKTTANYKDYKVYTHNNIHSRSVQFRISYTFGGIKVNNVYRDSKERESNRSN